MYNQFGMWPFNRRIRSNSQGTASTAETKTSDSDANAVSFAEGYIIGSGGRVPTLGTYRATPLPSPSGSAASSYRGFRDTYDQETKSEGTRSRRSSPPPSPSVALDRLRFHLTNEGLRQGSPLFRQDIVPLHPRHGRPITGLDTAPTSPWASPLPSPTGYRSLHGTPNRAPRRAAPRLRPMPVETEDEYFLLFDVPEPAEYYGPRRVVPSISPYMMRPITPRLPFAYPLPSDYTGRGGILPSNIGPRSRSSVPPSVVWDLMYGKRRGRRRSGKKRRRKRSKRKKGRRSRK